MLASLRSIPRFAISVTAYVVRAMWLAGSFVGPVEHCTKLEVPDARALWLHSSSAMGRVPDASKRTAKSKAATCEPSGYKNPPSSKVFNDLSQGTRLELVDKFA